MLQDIAVGTVAVVPSHVKNWPFFALFIPAASTAGYGIMGHVGEYGTVWSSSLYSFCVKYGHYLYLARDYISLGSNYRFYGRSVRGVIG